MPAKSLFFLLVVFLMPWVSLAEKPQYGSVCLGPHLSKVPEQTWVQINHTRKHLIPEFSSAKSDLITTGLDLAKKHKVTVYAKSSFTNEEVKLVASWYFKFAPGGTDMVTIFRSPGGWQLFQNQIAKCEFPITGCGFKYLCK